MITKEDGITLLRLYGIDYESGYPIEGWLTGVPPQNLATKEYKELLQLLKRITEDGTDAIFNLLVHTDIIVEEGTREVLHNLLIQIYKELL